MFIYDLLENNIETATLKDYIKIREPSSHNLRHINMIDMPLVTRNYLYNNPFLTMCRNFNKISDIYLLNNYNRKQFKKRIEDLNDAIFM